MSVTLDSLNLRREQPIEYSEDKTKWTKNFEDRRNLIDIEASLALSFMSGLVKIKGSAKYLDDRQTKKNSVSVSSVYYATNSRESVTQDMRQNLDYFKSICAKVGKKEGPTHVVSSITRGFRGILTFKKTTDDESKNAEVGGSLEVIIKSLPGIQIEGSAKVDFKENEKKYTENLEVSYTGDAILDTSVTSIEGAVKTYKMFPSIAKESRAVVKFTLSRIEKYCTSQKALLAKLSDQLTLQVLKNLQELEDSDIELETLKSSKAAIAFSASLNSNLNILSENLFTHTQNFKRKIGEVLPKIRGGFGAEAELIDLLNEHIQSPFKKDKLDIFLGKVHYKYQQT